MERETGIGWYKFLSSVALGCDILYHEALLSQFCILHAINSAIPWSYESALVYFSIGDSALYIIIVIPEPLDNDSLLTHKFSYSTINVILLGLI